MIKGHYFVNHVVVFVFWLLLLCECYFKTLNKREKECKHDNHDQVVVCNVVSGSTWLNLRFFSSYIKKAKHLDIRLPVPNRMKFSFKKGLFVHMSGTVFLNSYFSFLFVFFLIFPTDKHFMLHKLYLISK